MRKCLIGMLGMFMAGGVFADVVMTVTGTADSTTMGYASGQSYTFTWVVSEGYTGAQSDDFTSSVNEWTSELTTQPLLWSAFSGDGLVGSYVRPSVTEWAPFEQMMGNRYGLTLMSGNDDTDGSLGLTVDGVEVLSINMSELDIGTIDYSATSFVNPATWLNDYVGTYDQSGVGAYGYVLDEAGNFSWFTPTSLTIEAVPEPATALSLLIGGGLLTLIRRFYGRA